MVLSGQADEQAAHSTFSKCLYLVVCMLKCIVSMLCRAALNAPIQLFVRSKYACMYCDKDLTYGHAHESITLSGGAVVELSLDGVPLRLTLGRAIDEAIIRRNLDGAPLRLPQGG